MGRTMQSILVVVLLTASLFAAPPASDREQLWSLEKAYWQYVQANDLQKYRALWHPDFLGWPYVSPEPLRKDHITDWITAHTSKGESLHSYELEPLIAQVTGDVATTTYRMRMSWTGKDGAGKPSTIRVIHTWARGPGGRWQIISGMSAPTDAQGH